MPQTRQQAMRERYAQPIGHDAVATANAVRPIEKGTPDMEPTKQTRLAAPSQVAVDPSTMRTRTHAIWAKTPAPTFAPFLSETEKDDIAETGSTFTVIGINKRNTVYGETWMIDVEWGGMLYTIAQSCAPYRDDTIIALQEGLREYGPFTATLTAFDTANGHGWSLAQPQESHDETPY